MTHRDGSVAWLSTLKSPLLDENGHVTGVITHNRDVTAKKELETALAESERKATAALTNMADGLVIARGELINIPTDNVTDWVNTAVSRLRSPGTVQSGEGAPPAIEGEPRPKSRERGAPPLTAPAALDFTDIANLLSEISGQAITRKTPTDDEFELLLAARGLPPAVIAITLSMYRAARVGEFARTDPALGTLLGREPISARQILAS